MEKYINYFSAFPGLAAALAVAFLILFFVVLERIIDPPPAAGPIRRKPGRINWWRHLWESVRRALLFVTGGGRGR